MDEKEQAGFGASFLLQCYQIIKALPDSKLAVEAQKIIDLEHKRVFGK